MLEKRRSAAQAIALRISGPSLVAPLGHERVSVASFATATLDDTSGAQGLTEGAQDDG